MEYFQKCEEIKRLILGENHPEYATILSNLGLSYFNLGLYQQGLGYL